MKRSLLTGLVLCLMFGQAFATESADCAALAKTIEAKTGARPDSVRKMPMLGLYEVLVNHKLVYMDKSGRYLIAGHVVDTVKDIDYTARRIEELNRIKWETLPLQDAIKVVYGNGKRRLVVFTDTKCTYCKLLEQSLKQVSNVTVYNFLHPVLNSRALSRRILCAKNPVAAFKAYMDRDTLPEEPVGKCDDSSLDRNLALGRRLGITGTPVMIFEDGSSQAGALPTDALEKRLNSKKQ